MNTTFAAIFHGIPLFPLWRSYVLHLVINGRLGLSTPEIITPLELFKEENEDDF